MFLNSLYYKLKPIIPRWLQIQIRRQIALRKRAKYAYVWPIDEKAAKTPEGWTGWPDGKKFALVLTHDVETVKGLKNCRQLAEIEESLGFRSSFNFVAEDYEVPDELIHFLKSRGFEAGVHGLHHHGNLFGSRKKFNEQVPRINRFIERWGAKGFRTPSLYHNLDWIAELDIEYDSSTFDTDPFEPQPDGVGTIFPFWVSGKDGQRGYIELPYTLPQDHSLFVIMGEKNIDIWKKKLDWIAEQGGMALLITHPDYINFGDGGSRKDDYPLKHYKRLLEYVRVKYLGYYWHVLPGDMARYCEDGALSKKTQNIEKGARAPSKQARRTLRSRQLSRKKIWIDLDNSPHVPFFHPIINQLESLGQEVFVTARDCSQTCGLADLFAMQYKRVGRHYGKNIVFKVTGTVYRATQLSRVARKHKPNIAISHGSRAQMLSALMLGVPTLVIMDYEHVKGFVHPTWVLVPEIISDSAIRYGKDRILRYPGIKEDVYVPCFKPDLKIRHELGIEEDALLVTIRPPAIEAHYHNPQSETLFLAAVNYLGNQDNVRMVILPRYDEQRLTLTNQWPEWCRNGKILIPEHVVDGLNLIWASDFVISGGGTMNREAAALGVPVYSIFRGKIGAVDRYLSQKGRLTLLEDKADIPNKIKLVKRDRELKVDKGNGTLDVIVNHILKVLETR
jgi:predicted glycosyltransferase/peptidoglycan/xylan/chitin deacetylase (PgdA/CDA1 family)